MPPSTLKTILMKKVQVSLTFGVPGAPGVDPQEAYLAYVRLRCLTFNPGKFQPKRPSSFGAYKSQINKKKIYKYI